MSTKDKFDNDTVKIYAAMVSGFRANGEDYHPETVAKAAINEAAILTQALLDVSLEIHYNDGKKSLRIETKS